MVSLGLCKSHYLPINPLSANRKRGIIPSGFCDAKHRLLFLGHLAHPPMRGLQNYHIGRVRESSSDSVTRQLCRSAADRSSLSFSSLPRRLPITVLAN